MQNLIRAVLSAPRRVILVTALLVGAAGAASAAVAPLKAARPSSEAQWADCWVVASGRCKYTCEYGDECPCWVWPSCGGEIDK